MCKHVHLYIVGTPSKMVALWVWMLVRISAASKRECMTSLSP